MSEFDSAVVSSKVSALVEAARVLDRPTESDRARVHARLTAALAASAPVSGAEQPTESAANGGSTVPVSVAAFAGQALLVMVLSAALTSAVIWSQHAHPRASHHARISAAAPVIPALVAPEAAAPASELAAASGEAPLAGLAAASGETPQPPRHPTRPTRLKKPTVHSEPAAEPEPAAPPPPAAKPIGPPPPTALAASVPTPASGLGGELALLVAAQHALAANALERALTLLDQHAARYPTGSLLPERLAARAATLCRLQRREEGARTLRELRLRAPSSPLLPWANGQCQREAR